MNKLELAEKAILAIEKAMPAIKVYNLGKTEKDLSVQRRSSGSFKFDTVLGGGWPKGRIIEIFGAESSGKTSMCLVAAAEVTRKGGMVLFIDAEQALDTEYARKIGVDMNHFFLVQPGYGEEAFNVLDGSVRSGAFDLIIVDSVSALTPKAVLDGDAEDVAQIGILARLMSKNLSRTVPILGQNGDTVVVFINQERMKIGGFTMGYGDPVETTGGKALKFYASARVQVKKGEPISRGEDRIGNVVRISVVKNKTSAPFQKCDIRLMFDAEKGQYGVDSNQEVVDIAIDKDMLGTRGRFVSLTGEVVKASEVEGVKLDGKEALADYLLKNLDQVEYLKEKVLKGEYVLERNAEGKVVDFKATSSKKEDTKKVEETSV